MVGCVFPLVGVGAASMKVPPESGEIQVEVITPPQLRRLNESPHAKVEKFVSHISRMRA